MRSLLAAALVFAGALTPWTARADSPYVVTDLFSVSESWLGDDPQSNQIAILEGLNRAFSEHFVNKRMSVVDIYNTAPRFIMLPPINKTGRSAQRNYANWVRHRVTVIKSLILGSTTSTTYKAIVPVAAVVWDIDPAVCRATNRYLYTVTKDEQPTIAEPSTKFQEGAQDIKVIYERPAASICTRTSDGRYLLFYTLISERSLRKIQGS